MDNARYAVKYTTTSTVATTRAKSLSNAGPLLIASDHLVNKILPDVVVDLTNGEDTPRISMRLANELLLGGLVLDPAVCSAGMHFSLINTRLAAAFQDVDAAGI